MPNPTICHKCKYHRFDRKPTKHDDLATISWNQKCTHSNAVSTVLDYVTGRTECEEATCCYRNKGKCPDYEAK